jgi:hypothetical protein
VLPTKILGLAVPCSALVWQQVQASMHLLVDGVTSRETQQPQQPRQQQQQGPWQLNTATH